MCDFYVITLFLRVNRIETSQLIAKIKTLRTKCAINPLQLIGRRRRGEGGGGIKHIFPLVSSI